ALMSTNPLIRLGQLGQSPWYDYITRDLIASGTLARLIQDDGLQGMTSNPTIFEKAIAGSADYDADISRLAAEGRSPGDIFEGLAVQDVRAACDAFRPVYDRTGGADGLVSLEVSPELANDTPGTIAEAARLWAAVDRPNAMIKIPGTREGLAAIEASLAAGISINITLLFSVARYEQVIEAFLKGLERRAAQGQPVDRINSVASFFVSRVDGRVDPLLDKAGDPQKLRGTIAIANAGMAYQAFERSRSTPRWTALEKAGARPQRPLWASTSTKDPRYPDVYYIEALVAADTVNTIPPDTFGAYRDHGQPEPRIAQAIATAPARLAALAAMGIDLEEVTRFLEQDGVAKFAASYRQLLAGIDAKATTLVGK
ncbi:MAG TPA: transaldolase, partial [Gemmatimonadales bacterium]|nr:transaldolase [Gemmatimonadales bacterium]